MRLYSQKDVDLKALRGRASPFSGMGARAARTR